MKKPAKRKSIRFVSDPPVVVMLNGTVPTIAFSEAAKGCGLVMLMQYAPRIGEKVTVALTNMAPLKGVVRWATTLDNDVIKIGIEYSEE